MSARHARTGHPTPASGDKPLPESPPRSPILDNEQPEQAYEEDIPKDDEGGHGQPGKPQRRSESPD